jgi:hypothetical protein
LRTLNASIEAALVAGVVSVRGLLVFEFGTGTYRYVRDVVPRVWDGDTYIPGGAFSVSDISNQTGFAAASFSVKLAASPDDGLTPAVLQAVFAEDYRDRPVAVYDAYLNVSTGAVIDAQLLRYGYVDRIVYRETSDIGAHLEAICFSRSLDYGRKNGRIASHANQKRRSATDKFREHAAVAGTQEIFWGRKRPKANS